MIDMKAKIYDSGSIKTVLVQDDNGDKFITGLEELLDMMDGEDNWEIETSNELLMEKLYKYNKLMKEVGGDKKRDRELQQQQGVPRERFLEGRRITT